jgi:CBS domain containing-hemolysin-like protein
MTPLLLFLLGCILVYLGSVQSAFSALMRLSLRLLAERNGRGAHLGRYLDDPMRLFVPARLLIGLALVLATVLVARAVGTGSPHLVGATILLTLAFGLVCEQLIPLLIVRRDPERVLEILLPSFAAVARVVQPLTAALLAIVSALRRERVLPEATQAESGGDEQGEAAHAYLEAGEQEGLIERDERRLLQSIVDFGDTLVREVMTPRPDVVAIEVSSTLEQLRTLVREQEYSRLPVFRENLDNIVGVVFVKDLIHLDLRGGEEPPLTALVRPAYFVPETKRVPELLKEFQRQQVQIAIVVDEYGGTAGLVTIEDLLEEIVGEIRDEYDQETEPITEEGNGAFVFSGKVNIDAVAERLQTPIEREGFETVGGYLLSHLGRVPAVGERFDVDGLSVEVLEAERRRVNKVRIRRRQQAVPEGS